MKKGYFELIFLLSALANGGLKWIERSRERLEAKSTVAQLREYLTDRLGHEAEDHQALSDLRDIEHFFHFEGGVFPVVLYTVVTLFALRLFARTELCSAMTTAFSRVWTWRP